MSKNQPRPKLFSMGEGMGKPSNQWIAYLNDLNARNLPLMDRIIPSRDGFASLFGTIPGPDTLPINTSTKDNS